jgi:transposase
MAYCKACFEKQLKIDELIEENRRLKAQLKYRERKAEEGPFGLSTPSSKLPFKENASEEKTNKKGGAVPGHTGHGRKSVTEEAADLVVDRDAGGVGYALVPQRCTVVDNAPRDAKTILYRLHDSICPKCKKEFKAKAPVLPRSLYGNHLTSQAAVMHYVNGINLRDDRRQPRTPGRYFSPPRQVLRPLHGCIEACR